LIAKRGVLAVGDSLLSKPFHSEQLLARVREALNSDKELVAPVLEPSG
jgi:DNA-binding response OmpR family regulator